MEAETGDQPERAQLARLSCHGQVSGSLEHLERLGETAQADEGVRCEEPRLGEPVEVARLDVQVHVNRSEAEVGGLFERLAG